jgi:hypothetical protein
LQRGLLINIFIDQQWLGSSTTMKEIELILDQEPVGTQVVMNSS